MVVVMEERASEAQIEQVVARLVEMGMDVHRSTGVTRTVLGAVGQGRPDKALIELLDGVHEVLRISEPYKLASKTFKPEGSIVSVGGKYKEATALEAVDKPLDPKMALKLNADSGRGSCVAVVKRALAKEKTLNALLDDAKGANCDGVLSVQLTPGTLPDRVRSSVRIVRMGARFAARRRDPRAHVTPCGVVVRCARRRANRP